MKKLIAMTLMLLSCGVVSALPIGNPSEASFYKWGIVFGPTLCTNTCDPCFQWFDAWNVRVGYAGDFVFNRNLEVNGRGSGVAKGIETTKIFTNAGYLVFNVADRVDLFGRLGVSNFEIVTSNNSWTNAVSTTTLAQRISQGRLRWGAEFSWSAGLRTTLFKWRCFSLGIEGEYFQSSPKLTSFVDYFDGGYTYFNHHNKMRYREWQVGTGLSYLMSCCCNWTLSPYAAFKWSRANFNTHNFDFVRRAVGDTLTIFNLKAAKRWGYAIGLTAFYCDSLGITVEGRWADEKGLYVNGQIRF